MEATDPGSVPRPFAARRVSRRRALAQVGIGLAASTFVGPNPGRVAAQGNATPAPSRGRDRAADIVASAQGIMESSHLRAVILRATVGGEEVVTAALGESATGVPATAEMRFRNGAVAISYMTTLLLQLVDRGAVGLDDPIAPWLPDLPDADRVTLRMLANMTAGYPDYVQNDRFVDGFYADPFRAWTPAELIAIGLSTPRLFEPGANWDYSHTGYVILGQALERIGDAPLGTLLQDNVLGPLGLTGTTSAATAAIPEPVLHAFTSERREFLGVDPAMPFYEESTSWNPSWSLAEGAVQTTTIRDMTATAEAIGTGVLLSPTAHRSQIGPELLGFGAPLEGCPACHTLDESYNYGLGVVLAGPWILQNPLFGGYGAIEAYLPSKKVAIAVVTTFGERSFDEQGNNPHARASWNIFAAIGSKLAPDDAPPGRR
ncbi:MAG: D-alanyl-D-alanine carboxypeptidase [uncultured Thermomicrobiales bacterium]|uniref:D-alanyl-D-alanine carboxypeptidase n=1 Tax=uncultured Thermomicrobiales bacterium TaxID=1645740 RepID=A0A6J4UJH0_9BACT|nr:MAG: D-alanyl-D-alanine carboxypeptidase [uncultured Thermomicrobiales bacterium]